MKPSLVIAAAAVAAAIAAVPLFLVTWPPLQDLPNHVATAVVLSAPPANAILQFYAPTWPPAPNSGTEIILIALLHVASPALAAKLVVGLGGLVWLAGAMLLHRAVYGRLSAVPLVAAVFLYNRVLEFGFLNFLFGTGLAACGFALWIAVGKRPFGVRAIIGAVLLLLLYYCHLATAAILLLALAIWEIVPTPQVSRTPSLPKRLVLLALVAAPPLAVAVLTAGPGASVHYNGSPDLLAMVADKLNAFSLFLTAGSFWLILGLPLLAVLLVAGRRRIDGRLGLVCIALFACALLLPFNLAGGAHVDWRMLAPFALFASALPPPPLRAWAGAAVAAAVLALHAAQTFVIAGIWQDGETYFRQYDTVAAVLPAGSRLVFHTVDMRNGRIGREKVSLLHFGAFALIEHGAIIPSLFADPVRQPVRVLPPYEALFAALQDSPQSATEIRWDLIAGNFDYLMLAAAEAPSVPPAFEPVAADGPFTLYQIRR